MIVSLYIVNHMIEHHPHQLGEAANLEDAERLIHDSAMDHIKFEREQAEMGWFVSPVESEDWVIHHYQIDGFEVSHRMHHYSYTVLSGVRPITWGPSSSLDDEGWVVFS